MTKLSTMTKRSSFAKQQGFSLIEILIALVIGLIAVLVITQVFNVFEGQKRSTTGSADAQTNGAIALYSISREVQSAGFGLPVFDGATTALNCPVNFAVDHDGVAGTAAISISPITILDGGAAGSDTITVRYGNAETAGIPVIINDAVAGGTSVGVANDIGCRQNDTAIAVQAAACVSARVGVPVAAGNRVNLSPNNAGMVVGNRLACIGQWNQYAFSVNNNALQRSVSNAAAAPVVADIVMIQAQYGISNAVASNQITSWVDATGVWAATAATPNLANRKLIKAVRVAVIARNSKIENQVVSTDCDSETSATPNGVCAWAGSATSPAPVVNLTGTANWDRYRYRVYETVIPLRNMVWSLKSL